jgi:hypothetical protein
MRGLQETLRGPPDDKTATDENLSFGTPQMSKSSNQSKKSLSHKAILMDTGRSLGGKPMFLSSSNSSTLHKDAIHRLYSKSCPIHLPFIRLGGLNTEKLLGKETGPDAIATRDSVYEILYSKNASFRQFYLIL